MIFILIAGGIAYIPTYQAISHNPQGVYCDYMASLRSTATEGRSNYIKQGRKWVLYNENKHKNYEEIYTEYLNKDINQSNWYSNGDPCQLTLKAYGMFSGVFLVVFVILLLILWMFKEEE